MRNNLLQEYLSPELAAYDDDAKIKGKTGVYAWTNREIYISLGFNTKLIPPAEAPKSIKDYLDPKWKGKMSIAGTTTGVQWVGAVMETMGREFLDKASAQDINVQNISGAALSGLVASGEVPLSPTIFNSNIFTHKRDGAPVEWRPLDPVIAGVGTSALVVNAPRPHAALLFLDYLHSKFGQEVAMKGGISSARNDHRFSRPKVQEGVHREQIHAGGIREENRRMGRLDAQTFHSQTLVFLRLHPSS